MQQDSDSYFMVAVYQEGENKARSHNRKSLDDIASFLFPSQGNHHILIAKYEASTGKRTNPKAMTATSRSHLVRKGKTKNP